MEFLTDKGLLSFIRKLISEYCVRLQNRVNQYSLRSQIIAYYNSLLQQLEHFPSIRSVRLCQPAAKSHGYTFGKGEELSGAIHNAEDNQGSVTQICRSAPDLKIQVSVAVSCISAV